jgi:hypothetical protein
MGAVWATFKNGMGDQHQFIVFADSDFQGANFNGWLNPGEDTGKIQFYADGSTASVGWQIVGGTTHPVDVHEDDIVSMQE